MAYSLQAYPTADLNDAHASKVLPCVLPWHHYGKQRLFAGRAKTLITFEDSALAKQLYEQSGEGAIAVVDGGGSLRTALLGDINASLLENNAWAGVIIHGAVRDSLALAQIAVGIMALGTTPVRSAKQGNGALGVPVVFGNTLIEPGDCLYCDEDGILVSKQPLNL